MELDPEMDEPLRVWNALRQELKDEEREESVSFGYIFEQKTNRFYDDLDDFAASCDFQTSV